MALCPRPSPSTTPAAMAMTFFSRAANLDPGDVVADVEAKRGTAERVLHDSAARRVERRRQHRRRQPARHLRRETRARQHDHRAARHGSSAMTCDMRWSESVSRPLVALTMTAAGGSDARHGASDGPQAVRGHREDDDAGVLQRRLERGPRASRHQGDATSGRYRGVRARWPPSPRRAPGRAPTAGRHARPAPDESASAVPQLPAPSTAIVSAIARRSNLEP